MGLEMDELSLCTWLVLSNKESNALYCGKVYTLGGCLSVVPQQFISPTYIVH